MVEAMNLRISTLDVNGFEKLKKINERMNQFSKPSGEKSISYTIILLNPLLVRMTH